MKNEGSDFNALVQGLEEIVDNYQDNEAPYSLIDAMTDEDEETVWVDITEQKYFKANGKNRADAFKEIKALLKKLGGWKINDLEKEDGTVNFNITK
jgi:hypothetical protein